MDSLSRKHNDRLLYIATFIKQWRLSQGMTRDSVGEIVNLHKNTIKRIENGENMTMTSIFEIADALEINISDIFLDID